MRSDDVYSVAPSPLEGPSILQTLALNMIRYDQHWIFSILGKHSQLHIGCLHVNHECMTVELILVHYRRVLVVSAERLLDNFGMRDLPGRKPRGSALVT